MSTKIILLFSLALDETHAVFNKSFATMLHAIGAHTGSDIFHFVVFFFAVNGVEGKGSIYMDISVLFFLP